jgi:hypothetical protein
MALFKPLTEPSRAVPELSGMNVDWDKLFGGKDRHAGGDTPWQAANARLRDEINEDEEYGGNR